MRSPETASFCFLEVEFGIGDLPDRDDIVVLEHVFPFPEACGYSDLISLCVNPLRWRRWEKG
jgi:hypothetical protein